MTKLEFKAKDGGRINDSQAQSYGQRLYELMSKTSGMGLTPADVVEDASNKSTVYHDFFEWDNKIAGAEFRLEQARDMMASIVKLRIVSKGEPAVKIRAFHNVVVENGGKHNKYVPEEIVFKSKDYSKQIIENALAEAESWNRRYKIYSELAPISKAIEKIIRIRKRKKSK